MTLSHAVTRFALLASVIGALLAVNVAPVAAADTTQFQQIEQTALNKLKDPWKHYAKGPDKFDCVGFVWFAYNQNGLKDKIGGYRGVGGYWNYFKSRGLVTKDMSKAQPGDLIVWGDNVHIGIYLGDGMAVSALINPYGVSKHKVYGYLGLHVKGFLQVNIQR